MEHRASSAAGSGPAVHRPRNPATLPPFLVEQQPDRRDGDGRGSQPPAACPNDPTSASLYHAAAKRDAATGAPTTREGAALLLTARPFDLTRLMGECCCHSSFVFARPSSWSGPMPPLAGRRR
jgi:hypothetical protein